MINNAFLIQPISFVYLQENQSTEFKSPPFFIGLFQSKNPTKLSNENSSYHY